MKNKTSKEFGCNTWNRKGNNDHNESCMNSNKLWRQNKQKKRKSNSEEYKRDNVLRIIIKGYYAIKTWVQREMDGKKN